MTDREMNVDGTVFTARLKRALKDRRMTQQQLADVMGTEQTQVSRWQVGKSVPSVESAVDLARALNVSVDWLFRAEVGDEDSVPGGSAADNTLTPGEVMLLNAVRALGPGGPDRVFEIVFRQAAGVSSAAGPPGPPS